MCNGTSKLINFQGILFVDAVISIRIFDLNIKKLKFEYIIVKKCNNFSSILQRNNPSSLSIPVHKCTNLISKDS